jgi:hypothetical protein
MTSASAAPIALDARPMKARLVSLVVLAALLAAFTTFALAHWPDEVDDVYIDALHARNLVEHGVIRLGAGEGPVEGFSSPLNVGLHAVAYALHLPAVIELAKARALLAANAAILLTYFLLRRLECGRALALAGASALAFSACFQYWSVAGLETPIYALFLLWAIDGLVRIPQRESSAVPLGLLAITRPEGGLFACVSAVFVVARAWRAGELDRAFWRRWSRWLACIALIAAPYFLFRWMYFGALFSNTYLAKITAYSSRGQGIDYAWRFLTERAPYVLAAAPLLFLPRRDRTHAVLLVALFVAAELAVIIRAGGDWMPRYRFMTQLQPLFVVLACLGVQNAITSWRALRARSEARAPSRLALASRLAIGVLAVGLLAQGEVHSADSAHRDDMVSEERVRSDAADYRASADWIRAECDRRGWRAEEATIALEPVGIIPYFTRCDVIDLSGKTSREIARAVLRFGPERHLDKDRFVADLVFERRPEFFGHSGGMHPSHQDAIMADPRFALEYERRGACGRVEWFARRAAPLDSKELVLISRGDELRPIGATGDHRAPSGAPRIDARPIDTPSIDTHPIDTLSVDARACRALARESLSAGRPVVVNAAIGESIAWFDALGDLGRMRVRALNPYYAALALTRGEALSSTLFETPDLSGIRETRELAASFADASNPWRFASAPVPHIVVECTGRKPYELLLVHPIPMTTRGLCLARVECRVERRRGETSGLYWGTFREHPSHPESIIDGGSALVPESTSDWTTLSAAIPVTDAAKYLSIGVGGRYNDGTELWVRKIRVVLIPEIDR